ncbi:LytTR family DNA-binding domain-containing protein [Massilia sp. TS11]|uniref:LytR/AlgR family response regulator transcription factor n=1 Tax=Massilia sp. TS11 TaxID=2908003 RepID=UPI001EDC3CC7|nr:LytTR family DNA-binding domain-containing protein [Massilia sp. TS11]MCG2583258.1 LytTR family DNA-binding domain-containing protein [Massilia sp. TS11]
MHVLIVDDERPARDKLRRMLAQEAGITLVEEAPDALDALERIGRQRPDALFLDVQMPEVSGLELAASLPEPAPLIVFVTAFDQYALAAFDANAIDYLLKPYDQARLARALARLRERLHGSAARPPLPAVAQLLVSERGATRVVRTSDIQWLETADNYVVLHTPDGAPLLRQSLAGLLDSLGPGFVRCHRRAAVQLAWVERLHTDDKGDGEIALRGGARAPLSRQFRAAVLARLQAA